MNVLQFPPRTVADCPLSAGPVGDFSEWAGAIYRRGELPNDLAEIEPFEREFLAQLCTHGFAASDLFAVRMILRESLTNAMEHGNRLDPSKRVYVEYLISADRVWIRVEDGGAGFDFDNRPNPFDGQALRSPRGRGLYLISHYADHVRFIPPGNCLEIKYRQKFPRAQTKSQDFH